MVIKLINSSVISTADILPSVVSCYDGHASWNAAVKVDLVTVMLQCVSGEESVEARFTPMIVQLRDTLDSWSRYRVARQAARFGLHRVARDWTEGLISLTSSEHNYYWLKSLLHCFDAESRLGSGERGCIVEVISQYRQGISCLKCVEQTCADLTTLSFAIRWAELRLRWVLAFQRMFEALSSFHSCPGSILHQRDTDDSSDPLSSFQRFTTLMHRICQLFRNVADGYKKLLKSSFDADCQTVELLRTLQTCLKLVMDAVRRIIHKMEGKKAVEVSDQGQRRLETSKLVHRSQTVQDEIQAWAAQMSANTITAQDVDAVDSIVRKLLFLPVPFPRFFFQKLQVTKIKLNITPQLKSTAEPMSIQHTTLLSLKAEGVIEHAYKKRAFRQINSVVVTLNTQIKQDGLFEYKIPDSVNKQLASEVTPHHDYFCAHFAIQFPVPSLYAVTITIQIRDDELRLWDTDVLASFQVKSFDEAARKQELLAKSTARKSTHAAPPTTTQTGKKKD